MSLDEIYNLIVLADATKDKELLKQAKQEIERWAEKVTDLYDLYHYELTKI